MTRVKTARTDPGVGGERGLEAFSWSCGFCKRQAFIQAVDGQWRFAARFEPAAATVCDRVSVGVLVYVQRMGVLYRCRWTVQHVFRTVIS